MSEFLPAHRQTPYSVRLEWGPTGAAAIGDVGTAVVVDVLSFTTAVTVGVERGTAIFPFRWRDERAEEYAAGVGATLARRREDGLSPAALMYGRPVPRLVLPSPNGSTIAAGLAEAGVTVVAASLRNRAAVARWLQARGGTVAVIPGGERWPDGSLRPAVEDLWGAGAVVKGLLDAGAGTETLSPEAWVAEHAFESGGDREGRLAACASGRELAAAGFADDVAVAAEVDASDVVPVLVDGAFRAAG